MPCQRMIHALMDEPTRRSRCETNCGDRVFLCVHPAERKESRTPVHPHALRLGISAAEDLIRWKIEAFGDCREVLQFALQRRRSGILRAWGCESCAITGPASGRQVSNICPFAVRYFNRREPEREFGSYPSPESGQASAPRADEAPMQTRNGIVPGRGSGHLPKTPGFRPGLG